jgi:hypothetical protein
MRFMAATYPVFVWIQHEKPVQSVSDWVSNQAPLYEFTPSTETEEELTSYTGRAIAQAVSRRLPTAAARVQTRI